MIRPHWSLMWLLKSHSTTFNSASWNLAKSFLTCGEGWIEMHFAFFERKNLIKWIYWCCKGCFSCGALALTNWTIRAKMIGYLFFSTKHLCQGYLLRIKLNLCEHVLMKKRTMCEKVCGTLYCNLYSCRVLMWSKNIRYSYEKIVLKWISWLDSPNTFNMVVVWGLVYKTPFAHSVLLMIFS